MAGNSNNCAYRACRCFFAIVLCQGTRIYSIQWPWQDKIDVEINKIKREAKEERAKVASGAFKQAVTAGSVAALGAMFTDLELADLELEQLRVRNAQTMRSWLSTAGTKLVERNYGARLFPYARIGGGLALTLGSLAWMVRQPVRYWREKQQIDKGMGEKIRKVKEDIPFTYIEKR